MLPFPLKLEKPNFGPIWGFIASISKQEFRKIMFYPIFGFHTAVNSCKMSEKLNLSI